jgi:phosphotransferase system enzyme I (PtsP)
MRGALGDPRVVLRRLRANMVAEACSVYVLRVDTTLELYATEGANSAVRQTEGPGRLGGERSQRC